MNFTAHIIKELRIKQLHDSNIKKNIIDLNDYFKYSGKHEHSNKLIDLTPSYRLKDKLIHIKNDMNKYKLKKHK